MKSNNEHRKTIRLNIDRGLLLLRVPGLTALPCSLHDLSATGCGARIDRESIDAALLQAWSPHFNHGAQLDLELSRPPHFKALKLQATVAHAENDAHGSPELGLLFVQPTPVQNAALERALQATASDKIKHSHLGSVHAPFEGPVIAPPPRPVEDQEWSHEKLASKSLAEVLVMLRLLTVVQAEEAERRAEVDRITLPRYLLKQRLVKPEELCRGLALHSGLPTVNLKDRSIPDELVRVYSYLTMLRYDFVPFALSKEMLCVAAGIPLSPETINELSRGCNKEVLVFLAPVDQIRSHLFKLRPRAPFKERQYPRVKASIPVSFQYCDENGVNYDDDIHTGEAHDVSEGGFLISTRPPQHLTSQLLIEQRAQVRLEFSRPPNELHALCLIRHIESPTRTMDRELHWLVGLQIIDLSPHDMEVLHAMCAKAGMAQRTSSFQLPSRG